MKKDSYAGTPAATSGLSEQFRAARYSLSGHGKREIGVLQQAMAEIDAQTASDMYGNGPVINDFEHKMAQELGMPAAVFFPSGTMAQQIALRIWCDHQGSRKVAYHPLCHLEIHEQDGLRELHHLEPQLIAERDRVITLEDVQKMDPTTACLLLELPQREIGGQLPAFEELEQISAYCREQGIRLHLDGARLFEILPYYEKTAAEVCALFDSVYISFYKGIGGVAGAILAGPEGFAAESKVWKRRHGGDLISLYPYIISSDYYYEQRKGRMKEYYEGAVELAGYFRACRGITVYPSVPVSNMFHVHFELSREQAEHLLAEVTEATGVGFALALRDNEQGGSYYEVSIGDNYLHIPKEKLQEAFTMLADRCSAAR
ncbi:threonine aldolase family protein [Paenibacillus dauci]|uniref:threonine aldolase family protein n=1 Tax=Paenibacillus dauci TaxID=1567106 RepID=UPI0006192C68|nr:beta-eliminating lyase-related protein [Paenibacillus dauci]